ncbi:unnamed protein product, partial [Mycena citricolor]
TSPEAFLYMGLQKLIIGLFLALSLEPSPALPCPILRKSCRKSSSASSMAIGTWHSELSRFGFLRTWAQRVLFRAHTQNRSKTIKGQRIPEYFQMEPVNGSDHPHRAYSVRVDRIDAWRFPSGRETR